MTPEARSRSARAYAELARAPNLFTSVADIVAALWASGVDLAQVGWLAPAALVWASWQLYLGGVVLNDYFDREVDARERPRRPIPSGRVNAQVAAKLGYASLVVGVLAASLASLLVRQPRSVAVALALAGMIVAYDAGLKRTPLGPVAMGACRGLNWLLGMSLAAGGWSPMRLAIAAAILVYIAGVTWFARREASQSPRWQLVAALCVMLAGLGLIWYFPRLAESGVRPEVALESPGRWALLVGVIAAFLARRAAGAIARPTPRNVQLAVKHAILSLVLVDAAVAFAFGGFVAAVSVAVLLAPSLWLARVFSPT